MGIVVDMTGNQYGQLVALSYQGASRWSFRCDCGVEKVIYGPSVRRGLVKSCGCTRYQRAAAAMASDIAGQRFGRLTAEQRTVSGKWLCRCDCGGHKEVHLQQLRRRVTQSCGCAHRDMLLRRNQARKFPELGNLCGAERRRAADRLRYKRRPELKAKIIAASVKRRALLGNSTAAQDELTVAQWAVIRSCFNDRCAYCDKQRVLTIDHLKPVSAGGDHTWRNVVPACRSCNTKKHVKSLGEALRVMGVDHDRFWNSINLVEERLGAA